MEGVLGPVPRPASAMDVALGRSVRTIADLGRDNEMTSFL